MVGVGSVQSVGPDRHIHEVKDTWNLKDLRRTLGAPVHAGVNVFLVAASLCGGWMAVGNLRQIRSARMRLHAA